MDQITEPRLPPTRREVTRPAPRAWIADKPHLQEFLRAALNELGFAADTWDGSRCIEAVLDDPPELIIIGSSFAGNHAIEIFEKLAVRNARASILLVGPSDSRTLTGLTRLGKELGLTLLPTLATPFRDSTLRDRIERVRPKQPVPCVARRA
jgi:DNA-binding NtrC family response regulator